MKKTVLILFLILLLPLVNGLSLSKEVYMNLTNQQIANYMQNNLNINKIYVNYPDIVVEYNLIMVRQNIINTSRIDILTTTTKTYLYNPDYMYCFTYFNIATCGNELVFKDQTVIYYNNVTNETRSFDSTYRQARLEGTQHYLYAIGLKQRLIKEVQESQTISSFIKQTLKE